MENEDIFDYLELSRWAAVINWLEAIETKIEKLEKRIDELDGTAAMDALERS